MPVPLRRHRHAGHLLFVEMRGLRLAQSHPLRRPSRPADPSGSRVSSRATPVPTFVRVPPRRGSPFCPAVMLVCLRFVAVVIGGVSGNRSSRAGQCGLREANDRRRLRSRDPRGRACVVVVASLRFEQCAGSRRSRTGRATPARVGVRIRPPAAKSSRDETHVLLLLSCVSGRFPRTSQADSRSVARTRIS